MQAYAELLYPLYAAAPHEILAASAVDRETALGIAIANTLLTLSLH
jgi:hypothetical protein